MTQLSRLRGAKTLPQLARVLGVQPASLSFVLYWLPDQQKYEQYIIPKKGGGWRLITAPKPRLKMIQAKLADLLLDIHVELEQSRSRSQCQLAHGFKRGFSIVTNATAHRNKRFVFNADLKDFFPSINFGRVRGFFQSDNNFSLDPKVATIIAQIACRDNQLPQGSPCSPVISNLIAHILDIHLNRLARAGRCTYTRYVDDITFSTNEREFPASIARLVRGSTDKWVPGDGLVKRVYSSGYSLNYDKTRMQQRDSRQDTTGLIVNKKVNVRNEYYKRARAKCDHLFKNGFCFSDKDRKPMSDEAMDGTMGFIRQIRGLKTRDWQSEQNSFFKLYRQFLDYRAFHGIRRPKIICEGKTDNIYLRCACQRLRARFPAFIHPDPRVGLTIDLFNYTEAAATFQDLSGGTNDLSKLLSHYAARVSHFKLSPDQPVIMIVDNDKGSAELFRKLTKMLGRVVGGLDPFYYVCANLYVVPVPKVISTLEAAIEDLFEPSLLARTIKGRNFDRTGKEKDRSKWYSKVEFATEIVKPERATINFSGFEPLLQAVSDVCKDFTGRRAAPPKTLPSAFASGGSP